ncbi:Siderophore exporter MmpL4 [Planctomycetaceae bacterium]|nr:Siderophore exporter MmpL4 [Planctomycetaceae bacterium]
MTSLWLKIFDAAQKRKWLLPLALVAILGLSGLLALRLTFSENIFDLLPQDDPAVVEGRLALSRFRTLERIVIEFEAADTGAAIAACDQVAAELAKTEGIKAVTSRVSDEALADIATLYDGRMPLLFDAAMEEEIARETAPGKFQSRLQEFVDAAEGKGGIQATTAQFRKDPYGLEGLMLRRFAHLNSGFDVNLVRGHLVSRDGRHCLLIADAATPASNSSESRALMERVDGVLEKLPPGVKARVIGGHRSAADNSATIYRDVALTNTAGTLGVLLLFLIAFRGFTPVLTLLLPVSMGLAFSLGLQGAMGGEISAITVGFGATMLSISGDYTIHLVAAVSGAPGESPPARARNALAHVAGPVAIAMLTTVLAIATLHFSRFDGLRQLATIAVVGVLATFAFAMTLGPQLLTFYARKLKPGGQSPLERLVAISDRARRKAVVPLLLACALVTLGLAPGLFKIGLEGDVTKLDGKSEATREAEQSISAIYGGATLRRTLIVVGGATLQQALRENDLIWRTLHSQGAPKYESIAWVLPAMETQRENVARWRRFWSSERIAALKADMSAARAVRHTPSGETPVTFSAERRDSYFAEFFATLAPVENFAEAKILDASRLRDRPLFDLVRSYLVEGKERTFVATTAKLTEAEDLTLERTRLAELKAASPSALALNRAQFAARVVGFVRHDLTLLGGLSLVLVLMLLWFNFRNVSDLLCALLPVAGGLCWTLGAMGWLGIDFNIINTLMTVFLAGLGIDYGIFVVQTYREAESAEEAHKKLVSAGTGIAAAALTTLLGFGSLTLARHPALFTVGLTTCMGVLSAFVLAVFVVPSIMDWRVGRHKVHG